MARGQGSMDMFWIFIMNDGYESYCIFFLPNILFDHIFVAEFKSVLRMYFAFGRSLESTHVKDYRLTLIKNLEEDPSEWRKGGLGPSGWLLKSGFNYLQYHTDNSFQLVQSDWLLNRGLPLNGTIGCLMWV